MTEPIGDPEYWRERLEGARTSGALHHAVFRCGLDRWRRIEASHRRILAATIGEHESVLDAGCGWGRLLDLLPSTWKGDYLGVDLSPDFVALAKRGYPWRDFRLGDIASLALANGSFDWAVCISMRPMIRRNCGGEVWDAIARELSRVAARVLYLEYDEDDPGCIEG